MSLFLTINCLLFVFVIIAVLGSLKIISLAKENRLLSNQLTETTISLEQTRKDLEKTREKYRQVSDFQSTMNHAELTTQLQKPRLNHQNQVKENTTPEKYRYIHSLTKRGMTPEEIASILSISTHESRQLVTLAQLGRAI